MFLFRLRRSWYWEDIRVEAVHALEDGIQTARYRLRRALHHKASGQVLWTGNASYTVDDFTADLEMLRRTFGHWKTGMSFDEVFRSGEYGGWVLRETLSPFSLDRFGESRSWDYGHRFLIVLAFLSDNREALLATPEKLLSQATAGTDAFPFQFNPLFLEFLLGGFQDPVLPDQHAWHPLASSYEVFNYQQVLSVFREWMVERERRTR